MTIKGQKRRSLFSEQNVNVKHLPKEFYWITFVLLENRELSFKVSKTRKIEGKQKTKIYFIPKSIVLDYEKRKVDKNFPDGSGELWYSIPKIDLKLPKWFCEKDLGFYK